MQTITKNKLQQSYDILDKLRLPNSMYYASPHSTYNFVWIRDSCFIALTYIDKPCQTFEKTIWSLLDMFKTYEYKLDIHTKVPPQHTYEYIHARYSSDLKEIPVEWNHRQNDCPGIFLYCVGEGMRRGKKVLRDEHDKRIIQKIVNYLETLRFYENEDGGFWEEINERRSSSIATCTKGLMSVRDIVNVPDYLIKKGLEALYELFPYETPTRKADLAQLSIVYYGLFGNEMSEIIIKQVEDNLVRERGIVRYRGDSYFSTLEEEHGRGRSREFYVGTEAEWCFGFAILSIVYNQIGNKEKAKYYLERLESVMLEDGSVPELYYAKTNKHNVNSPLTWGNAMYIQAAEMLNKE